MKCGCGELSQKETCVSLAETLPTQGGKGTTNLIQKVIPLSLPLFVYVLKCEWSCLSYCEDFKSIYALTKWSNCEGKAVKLVPQA